MKNYFMLAVLVAVFSGTPTRCPGGDTENEITLWPEIEPYETGYLQVSDIHQIYYEICGNSDGKTVFVLHGGPGGGCSQNMRRYFNPEKFRIVLHDQRGAGKSKPFAEIRENTTQDLVEDIECLRKRTGAGKVILFGGSWGTTLGLAYAETYPENVSGMLLRGIFTATRAEIDHFYHGGVRNYYPEVYDRFTGSLPDPGRRPLPPYLLELIQNGDADRQNKYSLIWGKYEAKVSVLEMSDDAVDELFETYDPLAFALLENYYMANRCFLEEGQLLRDADKIKDIPLIMVNGRYDLICPPVTAYELHKKLPLSTLIIAESAGHWMGDPNVQKALLSAAREFE